MAKILLIIAALVTAGTAYLGFATKQKVDALQGNLKDTTNRLTATTADLNKTKTTLKKTEEDLTAAKATIEDKEKDIATKKGEIDKLTSDLSKATMDVEEKTKQIGMIQAELDKLSGVLTGIKPEELAAKIKELSESKSRLETELAEAKQVLVTLNDKLKEKDDKLVGTEQQVEAYKKNFVKNGLTGSILAYNPGWNFVVLSIGDKQGLKPSVQMVVSRAGQMVAKVKVTTVEPGTAIADIIPGTTPRGMSVQPGDTVVYEGRPQ